MLVSYVVYGRFVKEYSPLRGFPGLTLRGAFGLALRRVSCRVFSPDCRECPAYGSCVYSRMFESTSLIKPSARVAGKSGREGVTNPYTLELLYVGSRRLRFALNLFGEAVKWEGYALTALVGMGLEGLGLDMSAGERRAFAVERIDRVDPGTGEGRVVFSEGAGFTLSPEGVGYRSLLDVFDRRAREILEAKPRRLLLFFRSPYRLIEDGRVTFKPSFKAVVMNLARRYSMLAEYHGAGRPLEAWEARGLRSLASRVRLSGYYLVKGRVKVWKRSIEGEVKEFGRFAKGVLAYRLPDGFWRSEYSLLALKLLLLGEYLHVGKLAVAGYGDYDLYFS